MLSALCKSRIRPLVTLVHNRLCSLAYDTVAVMVTIDFVGMTKNVYIFFPSTVPLKCTNFRKSNKKLIQV